MRCLAQTLRSAGVCDLEVIDSSRCRQNAEIWAYELRLAELRPQPSGSRSWSGGRLLEADPRRVSEERQSRNQAPYLLERESGATLRHALSQVCLHGGRRLLAAHVHVVVEGEPQPEKIRNDFKSYACGSLNRPERDGPDRKRWARHGSTRWLRKDQDVREEERSGGNSGCAFGGFKLCGVFAAAHQNRACYAGNAW